jgi:hypothetical protein
MMNSMTRQTQNLKIFNDIVLSVFVDVMNFKFATGFFTSIAKIWKRIQSYFSVTSDAIKISSIFNSRRFFSCFGIKSCDLDVHAFSRTVFPVCFSGFNVKQSLTFFTNQLDHFSGVECMKAGFAAKNITAIITINLEKIATLFAALRFPDFGTRSRIACFGAI